MIDLTQESEEEEAGRSLEAESETGSEEQQDSEVQWGFEQQEESGDCEESEEVEDSEEGEDPEDSEGCEESEESEEHEDSDATSQQYDVQESEGLQWLVATQVTHGVSYSVTGYHHRPWGGGDDFHTVGIFNTEAEAKVAALDDYRDNCEGVVDGWEYCW